MFPQGSTGWCLAPPVWAEGSYWPHISKLKFPGSPFNQSCPMTGLLHGPRAAACPGASWHQSSALFSAPCIPSPCTAELSHTVPCVLSRGAQVGELQITATLPTPGAGSCARSWLPGRCRTQPGDTALGSRSMSGVRQPLPKRSCLFTKRKEKLCWSAHGLR